MVKLRRNSLLLNSLEVLKVLALSVMCLYILQCCRSKDKKDDDMGNKPSVRDINKVIDAHSKEWMSLPGIVGCYVSINEKGDSCIVIMAVKKTTEITKKIPKTIEGYPVEIQESGEVKPLERLS
jgi:hypothetical protein